MAQYALIDSSSSEAASDDEHGLLVGVKTEALARLFFCDTGLQKILPYGVARHDYLVSREEALHAFVSYAHFLGFLRK